MTVVDQLFVLNKSQLQPINKGLSICKAGNSCLPITLFQHFEDAAGEPIFFSFNHYIQRFICL